MQGNHWEKRVRFGKAAHAAGGSESQSRLAAIVESSADAIVSETLDGIVTSWNAGATAVYGYGAEEMIGHDVSVLFPRARDDELVPILDQIQRGRRVGHYESKRLRKDGTIIEVSVSISPVRDGSGAIVGIASVARDITERTWAEAERRASEARLHQAERMETVGQLAGGIAQDMNNVLSAIMGYTALVADATADDPVVRADVQQIQAAVGRAGSLTGQLLVFSRREPIQPEKLDLNSLLTSMRGLLQGSVGGRIELRFMTAPDLPTVMADRAQVEQVVLNLAVNARDAMPEGGILTLSTSLADLSKVSGAEWPGGRPGHYVELAVSDTGCGMDAGTMRHVFDPFFTTKPAGQGTGLGLSTVYGIITKAGGGITIESEEGRGATFHIYLPAIHVPAPVPPARTPPPDADHGETILVVDDEPAVLEITSRILRHHGYHTIEAATFDEALSLMSSCDVHLLLSDSILPGMPGLELVGRALGMKPGIPVLHMSGSTSGAIKPDAITRAGIPIIRKPFTAQDLLEKVRMVLDTRQRSDRRL
jgi:two-component system cell cycle sensor histidine kinase/response regulator CckA